MIGLASSDAPVETQEEMLPRFAADL